MHKKTEIRSGTGAKSLVLGAGNILLKDEGIGPKVIEALRKERLPSDVELIDAGTQILDTMLAHQNVEKLIIVDTVKTGGRPGAIYRFRPEDIEEETKIKLSLHQAGLIESLRILDFQNRLPKEVVILGIEPKEIDWGLEPSEELRKKIPELIKLIKEEIRC